MSDNTPVSEGQVHKGIRVTDDGKVLALQDLDVTLYEAGHLGNDLRLILKSTDNNARVIEISEGEARRIARFLQSDEGHSITSLGAAQCGLNNETAKIILEALHDNIHFVTLDLNKGLDDGVALAIASAIDDHPNLSKIYIQGSGITSVGADVIRHAASEAVIGTDRKITVDGLPTKKAITQDTGAEKTPIARSNTSMGSILNEPGATQVLDDDKGVGRR